MAHQTARPHHAAAWGCGTKRQQQDASGTMAASNAEIKKLQAQIAALQAAVQGGPGESKGDEQATMASGEPKSEATGSDGAQGGSFADFAAAINTLASFAAHVKKRLKLRASAASPSKSPSSPADLRRTRRDGSSSSGRGSSRSLSSPSPPQSLVPQRRALTSRLHPLPHVGR